MGIRFYCPSGHKLNVKEFQAGRKGICPRCGAKIQIPTESTRTSTRKHRAERHPGTQAVTQTAALPEQVVVGPPTPATAEQWAPAGGTLVQPTPAAGEATPSAAAPIEPPKSPTTASAATTSSASADMPDPLAEAGDVVWYVRPSSGGQFGPAVREVMRGWIEEGRVGADSLVWREGWRDWREASDVFPSLGAGRVEPPPGAIASLAPPIHGAAAPTRRARSRRRSRTVQTATISILILAVIVLLFVFIWVLLHN